VPWLDPDAELALKVNGLENIPDDPDCDVLLPLVVEPACVFVLKVNDVEKGPAVAEADALPLFEP